MKTISIAFLTAVLMLCLGSVRASEADGLIASGGRKGGLCLVVGARDTVLAADLAGKGFYAQILQPDAKTAAEWGARIVEADYRENIGVRCSAFDAEHYGSNLFNLVVVEDPSALGRAQLADLCRILVPKGVVVFRTAPGDLVAAAPKLKMEGVSAGGFAMAFRKTLEPVEWKICDSLKWRAGTRTQHCSGFAEFAIKDGTISYQECMEVPGDIKTTRAQSFVRDAYNGRILSAGELSEKQPKWSGQGMARTIAGRKLFADPAKKSHWAGGCYKATRLGKYILSHHNIWDDTETKKRVFPYLVHPACFVGPIPSNASGLIYNLPSRKSSVIAGITAIGPAEIKFDSEPGEKVVQKFGAVPGGPATGPSDWPIFRANAARGNSAAGSIGTEPVKAWEAQVGRGGRHYGIMSGERTGLTQPVSAWGLVIVADIDAQRIVALDVKDGKQKWAYHVGSRVDMSPALHAGLCIFAAKDGWVYGLDAQSGRLCYRLLVAPRERYIGGQEKLENLWPTKSDVLIHNGVGYASAGHGFAVLGGVRAVAFRPQSGEIIWKQCYHDELTKSDRQLAADLFTFGAGRKQLSMGSLLIDPATGKRGKALQRPSDTLGTRKYSVETMLAFGNSLPRNSEDRSHTLLADGRLSGRIVAFSDELTVACTIGKDRARVGRRQYGGEINLAAAKEARKELWKSPPIEMVADDIVLASKLAYCVGHYERIKQEPELWVVSLTDGKVLKKCPVAGFPAFNGMSAAGNRLFIATRDGKLICFEGK